MRNRTHAAAVLCAVAVLAAAPPADELHQTDGTIVYGLLESEARSSYKFLEVGAKRAKTFKKKDVARIVLTYELPDFVYDDPQWSDEMVEARQAESFHDDWGEVEILRSEHYIVFTNSSAGERYLDTMEDIYSKFGEAFPFHEPQGATLMPVFLFKTNDHYFQFYADITGVSLETARKSGGHAWRDYYATYYDAPKAPVHYHEGAHQLVHSRLHIQGGGSWFQEGMAVYFEGTVFPGEDPAKGMGAEVKSGNYTRLREFFALPSLLYSSSAVQDSSLANRRYQQAGALIKFLKQGPWADKFDAFLAAVKAGESTEDIFGQIYQLSIEELDEAFVEHYGG